MCEFERATVGNGGSLFFTQQLERARGVLGGVCSGEAFYAFKLGVGFGKFLYSSLEDFLNKVTFLACMNFMAV